mgnify:CR=1 FL=1
MKKYAVNRLAPRPMNNDTPKPLDRELVPNDGRMTAVPMTVRCVSTIVRSARRNPASIAARGVFPTRISSRIRSKIRMFVSTAMPIVSAMPARPGKVKRRPDGGHAGEED